MPVTSTRHPSRPGPGARGSGGRPLRRSHRRLAAAALGLAVAALPLLALTPAGPAAAAPAGFHTAGSQLLGPNGQQFAPSGFVLYCLAEKDLSCEQSSPANPQTDVAKIEAAAKFWHANTVRLQVAQEHLFSQSPVNASYLRALDNEVHLANSLGMVASITLQEEEFSGPPMPTATAVRFWKFMAQHYRNRAGVIFDLYNEPRLKPYQGKSWLWNIWRNGGKVDTNGVDQTFVGMQTLVNVVRATGAHNVVVAESNGSDHDLSQLSSHFLTGRDIAYGYEPNLKRHIHTPAQWDQAFGNLAGKVPLVMDAFRDYPTAGSCYPGSPTVLPQLLSYLQSKHLGLISWTMASGNTVVGNNLEQPTSYQGASSQVCVAHNKHGVARGADFQAATSTNGPGADILSFFRSNSHPVPTADLAGTVSAGS